MPLIDWAALDEPWRSVGLRFRADLAAIAADRPLEPPPIPLRGPRGRTVVQATEVPREGA